MAIDTSIYGLAGRVKSVADYDREALLADEARQQQKLTAMQIMAGQQKQQEYMRGVQRADALRQLAGRWKADTTDEQRIVDLKNSGFAAEADAAEKAFLERQKAGADVSAKKATTTKQEIDNQITRMGTIINVISGAKDQASYSQGRALLAQNGFDVSQVPEQFDPAYVSAAGQQALTALQRMQEERQRLSDEERKRSNMAGEALTKRGQDVSAATARRGQDVSAETARRGQDMAKDGKSAAKPLPASALKMQQDALDVIGISSSINADLGALDKQIESGKLKFGPVSNLANSALNAAGMSTEESRNFATFKSSLEKLRNDSLRLNSGVQTEGDAQRAWNELFQNINDTELVRQRLKEIQGINSRARDLQKLKVDQVRLNYGAEPLDVSEFTNVAPAVGGGGPKRIKDNAEYDALPKGSEFIDPNGQKRRKP